VKKTNLFQEDKRWNGGITGTIHPKEEAGLAVSMLLNTVAVETEHPEASR